MNGYLIQPPLTQLNGPYPAPYYLRAFLEQRGHTVSVRDHSIGLFEAVFCREGLARIFEDVKHGGEGRGRLDDPIVERFLGDEDRWLSCIDRLIAFLRGVDHEWGHYAALVNGTLPDGLRFHNYVAEVYASGGTVTPNDAPLLASKLLADIADFITQTLDEHFSLIRYMPSTARSGGFRDFSAAAQCADGYIMRHFYRPLLEQEWREIAGHVTGKWYLGLTVPFPGCLAGALACAESAKAFFGDSVVIIAGGGYVNTELRFLEDERLFDYIDYLSFDRGYGSLDAILSSCYAPCDKTPLYKTMHRRGGTGGIIVKDYCINGDGVNDSQGEPEGARVDDEAAVRIFPDYTGVNFSRYICPVDDLNPMHRLWSDGRWLKAYLAHGCYWRQCAFCDTSLDYIKCYRPVDVDSLFSHLLTQARITGIRGIHLVDEACPPASVLRLALLNREAGLPLVFWGNVRFEQAFTGDTAAILAAGGLIGISAGIEVATEQGFTRINKGIDLRTVVDVCAAFKEAGILTHAYCIYGYWDQDEQEIVDSAEAVRQLFAAGLLDSAFWHQFTLTRHSRIYAEWHKGLHPQLKPLGDLLLNKPPCGSAHGGTAHKTKRRTLFAFNDMTFAGAGQFDRYDKPLNRMLARWMNGDSSWADAGLAPPSIDPALVEHMLDDYLKRTDNARKTAPSPARPETLCVIFLGSKPAACPAGTDTALRWLWRFEDHALRVRSGRAREILHLLETAAASGTDAADFWEKLRNICGDETKLVWKKLRQGGLMLYFCGTKKKSVR